MTQPSQYRSTQLQYRFAVISEAPSILDIHWPIIDVLDLWRIHTQVFLTLIVLGKISFNCIGRGGGLFST